VLARSFQQVAKKMSKGTKPATPHHLATSIWEHMSGKMAGGPVAAPQPVSFRF
jgi:hypothetical protein